ncbi:MAG: cation-transporting P-type ATPase [Chloroflexaceae bacterium]|nr:cation-transporting P-type ATPase [Chloroflexaceae bacterium]
MAAFRQLGVQPRIISGDNPQTVAALARQAGLPHDIGCISGPELDAMSPAEFEQAVDTVTVFGRITPPRTLSQYATAISGKASRICHSIIRSSTARCTPRQFGTLGIT